jgi:hypothetical protein
MPSVESWGPVPLIPEELALELRLDKLGVTGSSPVPPTESPCN